MTIRVRFTESAERQLLDLYEWIAAEGSPSNAQHFVTAIADYCDKLADMPGIGTARGDIRPGLRTVGFRRRVVIAFEPTSNDRIMILGVFYGGQDYEARLAGGE